MMLTRSSSFWSDQKLIPYVSLKINTTPACLFDGIYDQRHTCQLSAGMTLLNDIPANCLQEWHVSSTTYLPIVCRNDTSQRHTCQLSAGMTRLLSNIPANCLQEWHVSSTTYLPIVCRMTRLLNDIPANCRQEWRVSSTTNRCATAWRYGIGEGSEGRWMIFHFSIVQVRFIFC